MKNLKDQVSDFLTSDLQDTKKGIALYEAYPMHDAELLARLKKGEDLERITNPKYCVLWGAYNQFVYDEIRGKELPKAIDFETKKTKKDESIASN